MTDAPPIHKPAGNGPTGHLSTHQAPIDEHPTHAHAHSPDADAGIGHGTGHSHDHHHHAHGHHHHIPTRFGPAFMVASSVNVLYVVAEAIWGLKIHAMSLLADAGHNLFDVLGLLAAWFAHRLAQRAPSARFTYGMRRATILSALGNAVVLLLVTGGIIWESILRFIHPAPVVGPIVSWVAFIGIIINGGTALILMRSAGDDLNMRGAFLHMASDAVMAFAVVLAGLAIAWTGLTIIDPIVSLLVSFTIIAGTWSLLKRSVALSLDGVPVGIDLDEVEKALLNIPGVASIHHLHVWPMSTTETALTVHITRTSDPVSTPADIIAAARTQLAGHFGIGHPTFQVEEAETACKQAHQNC